MPFQSYCKNIFNNYFLSFNAAEDGYSRKKIIATTVVLTVLILQIKYVWKTQDFSQVEALSIIDFGFVSALLGISAYQKVQSDKLNSNNNSNLKTDQQ